MHRQIFIPSEQNNLIPFVVPQEWYGKAVEFIAFPIDSAKNRDGKYSYLRAEKLRQDLLIAEGKMAKPILTDDVFSHEQEAEFNQKITFDDIFQK
jgi:hypothetical protein